MSPPGRDGSPPAPPRPRRRKLEDMRGRSRTWLGAAVLLSAAAVGAIFANFALFDAAAGDEPVGKLSPRIALTETVETRGETEPPSATGPGETESTEAQLPTTTAPPATTTGDDRGDDDEPSGGGDEGGGDDGSDDDRSGRGGGGEDDHGGGEDDRDD